MREFPWAPVTGALALALLVTCSGPTHPSTDQHMWTNDFDIRVAADIVPPVSLEPIGYTITVRDKKTGQPITDGQGRIFATNADGKTVWDGFKYGPEVGMYHAKLMFVTAGAWMMNVQFRRDSTKALQRPDYDWQQEILPGDPTSAR